MSPNHNPKKRRLSLTLILLLAAGLFGCGSAGSSFSTESVWEDIPEEGNGETQGQEEAESSGNTGTASESSETAQPNESSSPTRIFVGDSRTVGMYWALSGDDSLDEVHLADQDGNYWDAKVGIGLDWMKNTGIPDATGYLGPGTTLYILMGVNDMAGEITAQDYLSYLDQEVSSWTGTGASVIYVSVNPVRQEVSGITNEKIDAWNAAIQAGLPEGISFLDTNSQIRDHIDFKDDLHYHDDTNLEIYGICKDAVTQ
ncbi:MAG: SGNH/GDSL hydrolase family protein [Lachnospiraceae bacterium]